MTNFVVVDDRRNVHVLLLLTNKAERFRGFGETNTGTFPMLHDFIYDYL